MTNKPLVLLIEDNPVDALLIQDILSDAKNGFNLILEQTLASGLNCLNENSKIDAVLLDLSLPDSTGLETFSRIHRNSPSIPILILTNTDDESLSINAVQNGAQDYLIKGQVNGALLIRSIRYAIERKHTELKLDETIAFNQKILSASSAGILTYKSTGECIYANPASCHILGCSLKVITGVNLYDFPIWNQSGLIGFAKEVFKTGGSIQSEICTINSFEKKLWLDFNITAFKDDSEVNIMLIFNDITLRKETETALEWEQYLLRSLLDTHPDSIIFKDIKGKYIRTSKACAQKNGIDDPAELIGKTDFDLLSFENASLLAEYEEMIIKTGMPMVNLEMKESFGNKRPTWSLSTKMPLLDSNSKIMGTFGISRDITERKQVEEALSDSQKRYKSLFDDSPTPMWEEDFSEVKIELNKLKESGFTDLSRFFEANPEVVREIITKVKVLDVNKSVLKLHNSYRKEEIVNDITIVFTEETYKAIAYELVMIAQGAKTFDFNQDLRTIDNKIRHVIIRWSAASGYETSLSRVLISIIDITEHKLAEAALRESESMLKEAQKVAHIGSWTLDFETGDVTWSEELFRIYGLDPRQEAPKLNAHRKLFKASEWEKFQNALQNLKLKGDDFEIELNFKRSDGERRILLSRGQLKHKDDGKILIVGTSQDITQSKKIENELRIYREYLEDMIKIRTRELEEAKRQNDLILNAVGDGIFGINLEGKITFINPAAAQMLGWDIDEIFGQQYDIVIPLTKLDGSKYKYGESPISATTIDGQTRRVFDELFWTKNGNSFPVEYLSTPIWENYDLIGSVVVFSNITQQKESEIALEKAKDNAEMATKAKSEFLANMSHEIRTPMNSIIGFADLLALSVKDEKQRSQVESIRNSAKNLLIIINDILDLSKIEAGKLKFEFEPVNLRNLMREIENIFSQKIHDKGLSFITHLSNDIPKSIVIDDIRIRQVLFNLIGNAIKFTDQGTVKLSINSSVNTGFVSAIDLHISVEDTGIGIKPEQQQVIFDAFNQQIGQNSKKYGGTGLGLTITKRLVEMMGGIINVRSKPGKGSVFEILIPGIEFSDKEVVPKDEKTFDPTSVIFEPATVLICDDNQSDRKLLLDLLENYPLTLLVAENGKTAVDVATENHPDLILMDLKMPEMNGTEATKILRSLTETSDIPVIVISASAKVNSIKNEQKNIFDDFLLKPINLGDLVETLKKFLKYNLVEKELGFEEQIQNEFKLSHEQVLNIPKVIENLESNFIELYKQVMQNQKIDQIEDFGDKLIVLGDQYDLLLINQYGSKIKTLALNFDIEKLLIILKIFPKLIDRLKKMRGEFTWN